MDKSAAHRRQRGLVLEDEWAIAAGIADVPASRSVPFIFSSVFSRYQIPPISQGRGLLPRPLNTRLLLEELAATTAGRVQGG